MSKYVTQKLYIVPFFFNRNNEGFFFTHAQKIIRHRYHRLIVFHRLGDDSHRVRHENLGRSIKKIKNFYWKRKKLEHVEVGIWNFLRSKKIVFFSRKFSLKFVWKWKILRSKFSKIFDLKIFENFHWNLYENEKFWDQKIRSKNFPIEFFSKFKMF